MAETDLEGVVLGFLQAVDVRMGVSERRALAVRDFGECFDSRWLLVEVNSTDGLQRCLSCEELTRPGQT